MNRIVFSRILKYQFLGWWPTSLWVPDNVLHSYPGITRTLEFVPPWGLKLSQLCGFSEEQRTQILGLALQRFEIFVICIEVVLCCLGVHNYSFSGVGVEPCWTPIVGCWKAGCPNMLPLLIPGFLSKQESDKYTNYSLIRQQFDNVGRWCCTLRQPSQRAVYPTIHSNGLGSTGGHLRPATLQRSEWWGCKLPSEMPISWVSQQQSTWEVNWVKHSQTIRRLWG